MGTTATGARKLQLTINVPQPMTLRYLDVYPDSGQGYGPSLKAKGTVDGEDVILYVPGKLWAALKALKAAGVIADGQYDEEPTERYNIPVLVPEIVITREQKPGAKYAEIVVQAAGAAKPAPKANGKEGHTLGGPIPGLDDVPAPVTPVTPTKAAVSWADMCERMGEAMVAARAICEGTFGLGNFSDETAEKVGVTLWMERMRRGV